MPNERGPTLHLCGECLFHTGRYVEREPGTACPACGDEPGSLIQVTVSPEEDLLDLGSARRDFKALTREDILGGRARRR